MWLGLFVRCQACSCISVLLVVSMFVLLTLGSSVNWEHLCGYAVNAKTPLNSLYSIMYLNDWTLCTKRKGRNYTNRAHAENLCLRGMTGVFVGNIVKIPEHFLIHNARKEHLLQTYIKFLRTMFNSKLYRMIHIEQNLTWCNNDGCAVTKWIQGCEGCHNLPPSVYRGNDS
jgi:hypothetical protein